MKVSILNLLGGHAIVSAPNDEHGLAFLEKIKDGYGEPVLRNTAWDPEHGKEFLNLHYLNNPSEEVKNALLEMVRSLPATRRILR